MFSGARWGATADKTAKLKRRPEPACEGSLSGICSLVGLMKMTA